MPEEYFLHYLCEWCSLWLLSPNLGGITNATAMNFKTTNEGKRVAIQSSMCERDLVFIDSKLSFKTHVTETVKKCNKLISWIKRIISSRSGLVIKKLYTTLIRPNLEYCNSAVILKTKAQRKSIERVQRRAHDSSVGLVAYNMMTGYMPS
jgi:hypothetical protein